MFIHVFKVIGNKKALPHYGPDKSERAEKSGDLSCQHTSQQQVTDADADDDDGAKSGGPPKLNKRFVRRLAGELDGLMNWKKVDALIGMIGTLRDEGRPDFDPVNLTRTLGPWHHYHALLLRCDSLF